MNIEISIGEYLDRLSILEIKQAEIKDSVKLSHVMNELRSLGDYDTYKRQYDYYYKLMIRVNTDIWHNNNTIMKMDHHTLAFGELARVIYDLNQSRFRLKNIINRLSDSNIQEQKSYAATDITIELRDDDVIDIENLTNLSLRYDYVRVRCSSQMKERFEQEVPRFNYLFDIIYYCCPQYSP